MDLAVRAHLNTWLNQDQGAKILRTPEDPLVHEGEKIPYKGFLVSGMPKMGEHAV